MGCFVKKVLISIFIYVLFSQILFSQVEITEKNGKVYQGFEFKNYDNILSIIDLNATTVELRKEDIQKIEAGFLTLVTKNGTTYQVRNCEAQSSRVKCIDSANRTLSIQREEIVTVMYKGQSIIKEKFFEILELQLLYRQYPAFGLTFICPGGINLLFSYEIENNLGIRLSGGYVPNLMYGFQISGLYNILKKKSVDMHLSLGMGYTFMDNLDIYDDSYGGSRDRYWTYGVFGIDINVGGFYFDTGLSFGEGTFSNPQLMISFGFVKRFL